MVALDAAILMHPRTWEASGHLEGFTDPMVDCRTCKLRFRADKLEDAECGRKPSMHPGEHTECDLTDPRQFNLMFETFMGPVRDDAARVFLRPETAQGIFVNFKNVLQFARKKPPFGIAQIGKAFRNEITPGNFIFRTREFEMMEIEYFVPGADAEAWHQRWMEDRMRWHTDLGIRPDHLRLRKHGPDELSHYSSATSDIEYLFPMGWSELEGIANRGDFDLSRHAEFSGEKLEYFDPDKGEAYVPHVIEPSLGVDRSLLAFLVDAYDTEEVEGRKRTVLRLHPRLAPVKVAVLPLVSKAGMPERAREIYEQVRAACPGRVRRGRLHRPALPAPGRDRHALGDHRGRPDDGGRHGDPARPRQPRAGTGPRRGPGRPLGRQARRAVAEPEARLSPTGQVGEERSGPSGARARPLGLIRAHAAPRTPRSDWSAIRH